MSLDGLRAWISEVERKLGKRTRVFLALAVIAIGIAGAAVYLAIDAREDSVSENDLQTLQSELEAGGTTPSADVTTLEAEVQALKGEVEALKEGGGDDKAGGATGATGSSSTGSNDGGVSAGGADSPEQLKDLLERAKEQNAEVE